MARSIVGVIVVAVLGCGGPGGPDADDVRLTVYQFGDRAAGAIVWFSDPDTGEPIVEGTTGDDGVFFAGVPAGSSVTAALMNSGSDPAEWMLYTVTALEPGDDLEIGSPQQVDGSAMGAVEVTLPGAFAGAAYYEVSIGCRTAALAEPALPALISVSANCLTTEARVAVTGHAVDAAGAVIAFAPVVGLEPPGEGNIAPVSLQPWQTDFAGFTMTIADVPAGTAEVSSRLTLFHGGAAFAGGERQETAPAAGPVAHAYPYPTGLATRLLWQAVVVDDTQDNAHILVASVDGLPEGDVLDLAADGLPTLSSAVGAIAAGGSPALSCQPDGDPSAADGVFAFAQWNNPNGSRVRWHIHAPASVVAELIYPLMPESLRLFRGVLATEADTGIYLIDADHLDGYADFRPGAVHLFDTGMPEFDLRLRTAAATTTSAF